ncbi:TonB-dependent receptor [Arcicella sp. LKC2W]|uniref:TonB-dependent receptor n=1 Tax=Arcicella sp. LKC2W TaxID=2984198 RepID=UPI002B205AB2|nr:TonB-dependent receptor [Arcicella sp. LKC2W]MEA5460854.1 TonB-dependent receptor [Arcicella sp. LKC2W]
MKKVIFLSIIFIAGIFGNLHAQEEVTQMLRGKIVDSQSKTPLIGVNVVIVGTEPLKGGSTDDEGIFRIKNAPLGRNSIKISSVGYKEITLSNIVVTAGKQTVLDIEMEEQITLGNEIVVTAARSKTSIEKGMVSVSGKTFDIEETRRFSGSRNDPSRMVANFAGVVGNSDARNDIIIRGNSPTGLLWRFEGIDIPNPSHFGALGATGGPVTMLNNNLLARSAFLTGAFPANYGNAIAGVFDLQLRTGNNEKREYTGQVGFNGIELGAEGAFSKTSKASYLVNYRYSMLGLLQKIGLNFGTGSNTPKYQDLSFKLDFPTEKAGRFTVFGMGGTSGIINKPDSSGTKDFYSNSSENTTYDTQMGVLGLGHTYHLSHYSFLKTTIAISGNAVQSATDSVAKDLVLAKYRSNSSQTKMSLHTALTNKLSASQTLVIGLMADRLGVDFSDSAFISKNSFKKLREFEGSTYLLRAYANWQWKVKDKLVINTGAYIQHFGLNKTTSFEPRLGLRFSPTQNHTFSIGVGRHSQLQDLAVYFNNLKNDTGYSRPNENLGFTMSNQAIFGYETFISKNTKLKAEAYYQSLSDVPVQTQSSAYSVLNEGANFESPSITNLVNKGSGKNYGVELTIERNFINNYYFLGTLSLYESTYKGSDGVERNTTFNGNYVGNILAGREFKVSKRGTFAIDFKVTAAGGKRYTPFDIEKSLKEKKVYYTDDINGAKMKDYLRADLKILFRLNRKKVMEEWFFDFQNITGRANIYTQKLDPVAKKLVYSTQQGFYPTFNYRIQF